MGPISYTVAEHLLGGAGLEVRPYTNLVGGDACCGRGAYGLYDFGRQAEAHIFGHDLNLAQIVEAFGT